MRIQSLEKVLQLGHEIVRSSSTASATTSPISALGGVHHHSPERSYGGPSKHGGGRGVGGAGHSPLSAISSMPTFQSTGKSSSLQQRAQASKGGTFADSEIGSNIMKNSISGTNNNRIDHNNFGSSSSGGGGSRVIVRTVSVPGVQPDLERALGRKKNARVRTTNANNKMFRCLLIHHPCCMLHRPLDIPCTAEDDVV